MTATKSMSFMEAIKACYAKYFTFSGRARRSEFWWFYLFSSIVNWIVMGAIRHFHTAAAEAFKDNIVCTTSARVVTCCGSPLSAVSATSSRCLWLSRTVILSLTSMVSLRSSKKNNHCVRKPHKNQEGMLLHTLFFE